MLLAEYDYETDIAVQRAEEREIGFAEGSYKTKLETAKNLLAMNFPIESIVQATGLSLKEVKAL